MTVTSARHDELLRSTIEARGGYVFSTTGDAGLASPSRSDGSKNPPPLPKAYLKLPARPRTPPLNPPPSWIRRSAYQKTTLQHGLRYLVGLGQHGGAGLHHDLVAEADHFSGDVEVADAGLRSGR